VSGPTSAFNDPPPRSGAGGSGAKPHVAPPAPSPPPRGLVTVLALLPWPLVLFEFLLVLPRYEKLFRAYRLKVNSVAAVLLDISAWVRAHVFLAVLTTFVLMGISVGAAHVAQTLPVSKWRRLLALLVAFALPCVLFVLSWVGVMWTHRTLVEGLKR
jgi:hypothetical protein